MQYTRAGQFFDRWKSPQIRQLLKTAKRIAASDVSILLIGEYGTGKNVLAQQIHDWSPRRRYQFLTLSRSALTEDPFATNDCSASSAASPAGRLIDMVRAAEGGTLFIEEIAGLKLTSLEKVLAYASQQTPPLIRGRQTDRQKMRIVAAMDHDGVADAKAKILIGDLACRLNAMTLYAPTLRERPEDILPLAKHLLSAANAEHRNSRLYLSPEAATLINSYPWPGNIPELRDVIATAASRSPNHCVTLEHLPKKLLGNLPSLAAGSRPGTTLEELERDHIIRILCQSSTVSAAAKTLGINVVTLWRKRKRYNLQQFWPQTAGASRARA